MIDSRDRPSQIPLRIGTECSIAVDLAHRLQEYFVVTRQMRRDARPDRPIPWRLRRGSRQPARPPALRHASDQKEVEWQPYESFAGSHRWLCQRR